MAEAEAGLELPIGLTEQKFMQQLARIEAKAIKSAKRQEQGFVKSNQEVAKSFGTMSRQSRAQIQNVSYQLQDVFVQLSSGTSASRALSQQIPQMLGGFGALGAAIGVVAAVAIPLAANFFGAEEKAKDLGAAVDELEASIKDYQAAVDNANTSTEELVTKYGRGAVAAQQLLAQLAQIATLDAAKTLHETGDAIAGTFDKLAGRVAQFNEVAGTDLPGNLSTNLARATGRLQDLADKFGLTIPQAQELASILADRAAATSVEEQAAAILRLSEFLSQANKEAGYTNEALVEANRSAIKGALAAQELAVAMEGASVAAGGVVDTVAQLPGTIDAAAASAANLAAQLGAAIRVAQSLGGFAPDLKRFGDGSEITAREGGLDSQEQMNFRYEWLDKLAAVKTGGGGGGGRKGSGGVGRGGSGGGAAERPFFENAERDLANLQRELKLIGKTSEETATLRARWELLDEAKRRGLTVNDTLNAQIDEQAGQIGKLTGELERGESAWDDFESRIDEVAGTMADVLLGGQSLREGLANIFKSIAADLMKSGIKNAIMAQFGGSGGGNWLSAVFGAFTGGSKSPSYEGGGFTGMGGRSGGIDGKGGFPAILHPNETVIDHTRGQSAGGMAYSPTFNIGGRVTTEDLAAVRQEAAMGFAEMQKSLPARVQQINANPRRR